MRLLVISIRIGVGSPNSLLVSLPVGIQLTVSMLSLAFLWQDLDIVDGQGLLVAEGNNRLHVVKSPSREQVGLVMLVGLALALDTGPATRKSLEDKNGEDIIKINSKETKGVVVLDVIDLVKGEEGDGSGKDGVEFKAKENTGRTDLVEGFQSVETDGQHLSKKSTRERR